MESTAFTQWADRLTVAHTAFRSWSEFVESMRGGYCPTLYPDSRRQRQLRRVILAAGFRVWPKS